MRPARALRPFAVLAAIMPMAMPGSPVLAARLVGGALPYHVVAGDSLTRIGARFGVEPRTVARLNALPTDAVLVPGQRLWIDNTHVVPEGVDDGIVVNVPQRMLFLFRSGILVGYYPVGLGRPAWPTATGSFTVVDRQRDKTWNVPRSIQAEMRGERQLVRTRVPPGPDNPLGRYWLGLSLAGFGIHGTIAPASVYHFQSHGCLRLHADDIADLYARTRLGTAGIIVYAPVLLAELADGRVVLEVHRDVYRRADDPWRALQTLAASAPGARIDWERARLVVAEREGIARDVTIGSR
jgi:L,D-transpeptidase ErfK/SrfK